MPRVLRIGLWSLLALVVLIVAGAGIFALTFDPDSYKPRIIAAVKQQTGRDLTLQGRIRLGLSLRPTLTMQDVSFSNPPGFARPQMATLERLDLKLALLPLLSHQVEIDQLVLVKPNILLEIDAHGRPNWQFTPQPASTPSQPTAAGGGEASSTRISVAEVRVQNGIVTWRDDATGKNAVLDVSSLDTSAPSPESNMHIGMSAAYNGNPFTLSGDVGPLARFETGAAATAWPVQLTIAAAGARLSLAGTVKQPEQFHGYSIKLIANVPDLSKLAVFVPGRTLPPLRDIELAAQIADTGAKLPVISNVALHIGASDLSGTVAGLQLEKLDVAAPKADQPVEVAAKATLGGKPVTLNGSVGIPPTLLSGGTLGGTVPIDLKLDALGSNVSVKGTAGEGHDGRPAVQATVKADKIDADAFAAAFARPQAAPAPAPSATPAPPSRAASHWLIPDTPLPFNLLRQADADVKLNVGELRSGNVPYRDIATHLVLQDARLKLDPFAASLPEGRLDGSLAVDSSKPQPLVALRLNAPSLALKPMFAAMGKPDYISGNLDVHADLNGAGATPHAIASTLNGSFGVGLANGTIDNRLLGSSLGSVLREVNLLDMVGRGGTSQVQCFAARLDASHGIAAVRSLVLSSSLLTMDGNGSINLGEETLDLHLRPQGRVAGTELIVPLHVSGSLRAPSANPDPAAAVAANAGNIAGAVIGKATPLGMIAGALSGQQPALGALNVNCGAALASARGEAVPATPAPAAAAPAQPAPKPKPPNPGNLLKQLFR